MATKDTEWNWYLLRQEIERYLYIIRYDTTSQFPWTNLAYICYLMGEEQAAHDFLDKSYELAIPGSDFPGFSHKRVEKAMKTNSFLTGETVVQPEIPPWFHDWFIITVIKNPGFPLLGSTLPKKVRHGSEKDFIGNS